MPSANGLEIHPASVLSNLKPKLVLYHELVVIGERKFMTQVSQIETEWLFDNVPNQYFTDARKQIALEKHRRELSRMENETSANNTAIAGLKRTFGKTFLKKGLNLTQSTI